MYRIFFVYTVQYCRECTDTVPFQIGEKHWTTSKETKTQSFQLPTIASYQMLTGSETETDFKYNVEIVRASLKQEVNPVQDFNLSLNQTFTQLVLNLMLICN